MEGRAEETAMEAVGEGEEATVAVGLCRCRRLRAVFVVIVVEDVINQVFSGGLSCCVHSSWRGLQGGEGGGGGLEAAEGLLVVRVVETETVAVAMGTVALAAAATVAAAADPSLEAQGVVMAAEGWRWMGQRRWWRWRRR